MPLFGITPPLGGGWEKLEHVEKERGEIFGQGKKKGEDRG